MEGKRYLLDTNILSDLVRNPAGRIEQRIRAVGGEKGLHQSRGNRRTPVRRFEERIRTPVGST